MKIIAIGDIHGKDVWKKVRETIDEYDKVVFVGDYFDSFDIPYQEQEENYLKIIAFKNKYPDKVVLLMGNHDLHYYAGVHMRYHYSGYQRLQANRIDEILKREINNGNIQCAYTYNENGNDFVFTHAGLTQNFVQSIMGEEEDFSIQDVVNKLNETLYYKPLQFDIRGLDPYGDSIHDGCMWVRPRSLIFDSIKNCTQIVGHTKMDSILIKKFENDITLCFIDTFDHNKEQFLLIENGVVKTITL